jgi:hypothetical protein
MNQVQTSQAGDMTSAGVSGASQPPAQAVDVKTFAIGVLSVTATVLFVGFLMLAFTPRTAFGIGMSDRSGDYIIVTQQISNSIEGIVVIDAAAQRMNVYALDANTKRLGLIEQNLRLDNLPGARDRERSP